tara:strand:+ start:53 stop:166 length:114 start_codon:yes stop_codon:yes gene_type:complete
MNEKQKAYIAKYNKELAKIDKLIREAETISGDLMRDD